MYFGGFAIMKGRMRDPTALNPLTGRTLEIETGWLASCVRGATLTLEAFHAGEEYESLFLRIHGGEFDSGVLSFGDGVIFKVVPIMTQIKISIRTHYQLLQELPDTDRLVLYMHKMDHRYDWWVIECQEGVFYISSYYVHLDIKEAIERYPQDYYHDWLWRMSYQPLWEGGPLLKDL